MRWTSSTTCPRCSMSTTMPSTADRGHSGSDAGPPGTFRPARKGVRREAQQTRRHLRRISERDRGRLRAQRRVPRRARRLARPARHRGTSATLLHDANLLTPFKAGAEPHHEDPVETAAAHASNGQRTQLAAGALRGSVEPAGDGPLAHGLACHGARSTCGSAIAPRRTPAVDQHPPQPVDLGAVAAAGVSRRPGCRQ